jgi:hypothetical protein
MFRGGRRRSFQLPQKLIADRRFHSLSSGAGTECIEFGHGDHFVRIIPSAEAAVNLFDFVLRMVATKFSG